MVTIVLVEKTGELKSCKYANDTGDELYKKCKFKKNDSFELRHSWKTKKQKYTFNTVSLYARDTGKANTENKYDFPPPVDSILYFGCCCLVAYDVDNNIVDLSVDMWEKFYEDLFGGFENLADTAKEDEEEEDELENIPAEMKTKSGYLKDGFVVDDNVIDGKTTSDGSVEEDEWDDTSSELELEFEEYSYSDEN
jgi:uncharacterized protein YkuJ